MSTESLPASEDEIPASRPTPVPHTKHALTLTEGPIGKTLLLFSLPILASSILQSLNASINAIWIGRLLGERALTASANANSLLFFLLGSVFGLGMASTVLVGQSLGAKNLDQAKRTIGTSLMFYIIISIVASVAGIVLAPSVLAAMHTPPDSLPLASAYLRVIFIALPGMFLYSFVMMSLRGAGDAKTPFVFLLLSAVLDVGLNPLLIRGFGPIPALGIAGSALATAIAQWTSLIALIGWLYYSKHFLRLAHGERHYLRIDPVILRALIFKGVPMGLQMIVMTSSMLVMISFVNRFGSQVTAAYGACTQLWNYVQMPAFSIGAAVSSMAAQNVGAGLWDRVRKTASSGVLMNVAITGLLVLVITLADHFAFSLFLGEGSGAVAIAQHIHLIVSWSFIMFGITVVLAGVVRSTGAVIPPLVILFIALWLVRIPVAHVLAQHWGVEGIWWSFPIGSIVSVGLTIAYYRFGGWRKAHMLVGG